MKNYNLRPYPYPGKFEGGLVTDEYVYSLSVDGVDDEAGDISEYGLWAGLMHGPLMDEHSADEFELTKDEREFLKTRAGAIIAEDDLGFVTVEYFESPTELEEAWEELLSSFDCGSCGADLGPSDSYPWHYPDEDCRAIRPPVGQEEGENQE